VKLIKLNDTHLKLTSSAEDIRGRRVIDSRGDDMGVIDELLIDDSQKRVRFLRIASGGFMRIGAQRYLIPVDSIVKISDRYVVANMTREHAACAPPYDPEMVDEKYLDRLYEYYGHAPYWAAGYLYPSYPFYV
jgi:sporulation protein YlmC with PRC-barrel domain